MTVATAPACPHCGGAIAIRNPTGKCDHLYYPENCEVCRGIRVDEAGNFYVFGLREALIEAAEPMLVFMMNSLRLSLVALTRALGALKEWRDRR